MRYDGMSALVRSGHLGDHVVGPISAKSGPHSAFARLTTGGHFRLDSFVLTTILSLRVTCSRQCQLALHATDEPGKRGERSLVLEPGNP